tara:strand:+ start:84 stop:482 length:399 start_codon:yes stop_codon:yes gene_type:complete
MSSATEKFNKTYTEVIKKIEKNFSDLKAGEKMLISSPKSIADYIARIPYGTEKSVKLMRLELAKNSNADNTCPLTTGIFLRIAIEASIEQANGRKPNLPFWRVISGKSSLTKKLPISVKYLKELRTSEGLQD